MKYSPSRTLLCSLALAGLLASTAPAQDSVLFGERAKPAPDWQVDNERRKDPGYDGWQTEVLHDRAKAALKGFTKALIHAGQGHPGELDAFLAESFEGATSLRPTDLETVFDDGEVSTLRPAGPAPEEVLDPTRFGALVADLLAPYAGAEDLHAAFKIIKVDLVDEAFDTNVRFEFSGTVDGLRVQINTFWWMGWKSLESADSAEESSVQVHSIRMHSYEEVHSKIAMFGEQTDLVFGENDCFDEEFRRGIDAYYYRLDRLTGNAFIGGQGLAVGDVDGDGRDDLYVCQQGGLPNRLFVHGPDGRAVDRAEEAGVAFLDNTRGALFVDLDNDGHQDLALAIKENVLVAFNDGKGTFRDFRPLQAAGVEEIFSITAADPDEDGDLDLYGCRYVKNGIMGGVPVPYHDANNGSANVLWLNDGDRQFSSGTVALGFGRNNKKFSLASVWEDFDLDGHIDLYVTNDFGRNNLYRNIDGRYKDVAERVGADDMAAGMGASTADIDNDGYPDILVTNMFSSAGLRIASVPGRFMEGENQEVHERYVHHARGNTLLCGGPDGTFEDVSEKAGISIGRWGWGSLLVDLNNDGLEDLYTPNGFLTNKDPEDL